MLVKVAQFDLINTPVQFVPAAFEHPVLINKENKSLFILMYIYIIYMLKYIFVMMMITPNPRAC